MRLLRYPSRNEVDYEHYQAHNKNNVNQTCAHVKCEKPEQPKNDQDCGDYPKHVFISLRLSA
jgi:hypothetical protein